ncbi:MAG: hypothetical protein JOY57_11720 [Actinobacteria bacterium]|nr:hypothetical protein [Actinomycetota bacterium]
MGELLLGLTLVWVSGFWAVGIVQMRRAGEQPVFPGAAVQVHAAVAVAFIGGLALAIAGAIRL